MLNLDPRPILDAGDKKAVETAIAEAERSTRSEFVVAIVKRAGTYESVRLRVAIATLWIVMFVELLWDFRAAEPIRFLPALTIPWLWAAGAYLALSWGPILRLFLSKKRIASEAHEKAKSLFLEYNVHRTREHTGVLFLLCELEHRVVILADEGLSRHVGPEVWKGHADRVALAIRAGRARDTLVGVIHALAGVLTEKYPALTGDNPNELPDSVRE